MRPDPAGETGSLARLQHLPQFQSYALGQAWDEMFDGRGVTREHYAALYERLGAVQVGERLSRSVPGRSLPLFELTLRGGGSSRPIGRATYWR